MLKMDSMWIWTVISLCLTLLRGCCRGIFLLTEFKPAGPKLCHTKCELHPNCDHFKYAPDLFSCRLYKIEEIAIGGGGSNEKNCPERHISSVSLPENLQKLTEECQKSMTKDMSECVADRRNQLRCIKPAPQVSQAEDKSFVCGRCTLPGQQKFSYVSCRCPLGCSKKIRGEKATCHKKCEKYGSTFTVTKRVGIVGHNLDEKAGVINNCKWRCLNAKFSCLSYEYTKNGFQHVCHLQEITWLDVTEEDRTYNDTGWFYYHRDCL